MNERNAAAKALRLGRTATSAGATNGIVAALLDHAGPFFSIQLNTEQDGDLRVADPDANAFAWRRRQTCLDAIEAGGYAGSRKPNHRGTEAQRTALTTASTGGAPIARNEKGEGNEDTEQNK